MQLREYSHAAFRPQSSAYIWGRAFSSPPLPPPVPPEVIVDRRHGWMMSALRLADWRSGGGGSQGSFEVGHQLYREDGEL